MKSPILGWLACALFGSSAFAQTLVGTTTDPKGIEGLVVDGTNYNVTFSTTTLSVAVHGGHCGQPCRC
jgi:hypothetical protein